MPPNSSPFTVIRGDEWLSHPGSVGRPFVSEIRLLNDAGIELPKGEVGEIFMRRDPPVGETYYYLGSPPATSTADGFISVGDLGWLNEEGYPFIADRHET